MFIPIRKEGVELSTLWIAHIPNCKQLNHGTLDRKARNYEWSHATEVTMLVKITIHFLQCRFQSLQIAT